jgi:hypothetical protein
VAAESVPILSGDNLSGMVFIYTRENVFEGTSGDAAAF